MSKASFIAYLLLKGNPVTNYKEGGNSMLPIIKPNQPVDLDPVTEETILEVRDIVFCKVKGNYFTHLISKVKGSGKNTRYQISNNKGNMKTHPPTIFAKQKCLRSVTSCS